ncbi:cell division protein FtsA [bacterium]|nr:cell division protein FtsA [bacterium]
MSRERFISVLDIGTTKSCVLVAQADAIRYQIVGYGIVPSFGMKKGTVTDISRLSESITNAVKNAEKMCKTKLKEVSISVTGNHIFTIVNRGETEVSNRDGIITETDVNTAIEKATNCKLPADKMILHSIPRTFTVDGIREVENPIGMRGKKLSVDVTLIVGNISHVQNLITATENAGLKVKDIILQPFASGKAVLTADEMKEGVCLIDIGGGTTDVAIFKNGSLYFSFVVPVGGNHITNDLSILLKIPFDTAEFIKVEYGGCDLLKVNRGEMVKVKFRGTEREFSKETIFEIIEARVEDIFNIVNANLHNLNFTHLVPSGIVITGGSSLLRDINMVAERVFDSPVRIGYPKAVEDIWETLRNPIYGTALGMLDLEFLNRKQEGSLIKRNLFGYILHKVKEWFLGFTEGGE